MEPQPGRTLTLLERGLIVVAAVLAIVVLSSVLTGGLRLALGPIRISATDPARVALQAALVWLVAVFVSPRLRHRSVVVMISLAAVLITAAADSEPRRVGDGAEYLAMAINVSQLRSPALSADETHAMVDHFAKTPGFLVATLDQPLLVGADGRQDFPHFWLYSALVAPIVAVVNAVGLHPNHAFTIFNGALMLLLSSWFVKRQQPIGAALLVAGPLIWWVDKAHAEVFLFVTMAAAVLMAERLPRAALVFAAIAAAQNSGALVVFAALVAFVLTVGPRDRVTRATLVVAALIAALPAAYYYWHLGTWSPLSGTVERDVPGLRALMTALIDPNLGLMAYAPVFIVLAAIGVTGQSRRMRLLVGLLFIALLIVLSRPLNLNHGGTPGMSRYALWLLACLMPFIVEGATSLERSRPLVMAGALMLVVSMSWFSFRPEAVDRGGATPSLGATMIWTRWPGLDNPLPEVFGERASGVDGEPPVPVAIPGCAKALIRGDGTDAWWPFPCEPHQAPAECVADGALCYSNGDRFVVAPRQPAFRFDPATEMSWTMRNRGRLPQLRERLGRDARLVRLGAVHRTDGGEALLPAVIVEGSAGTAVWVRPLVKSGAYLRVRVTTPSTIELQRAVSGDVITTSTVQPGSHIVQLPYEERMLVLIVDAS